MKTFLIWGFLGSGKTTFINYLLSKVFVGQRVVVLENESGKCSVDEVVLRCQNYDVVSLSSGCVCCTLRSDLMRTIEDIRNSFDPDILLLEPSGLASLMDLLSIPKCHFDKVVTLLDIHQMEFLMRINKVYYQRQFALSPVIVLTKLENEPLQRIDQICADLQSLNPNAMIVDKPYAELPVDSIERMFDVDERRMQVVPAFIYEKNRMNYVVENYELKKSVDRELLMRFLRKCAVSSRKLVRAKGICCDKEGNYWSVGYDLSTFSINEIKPPVGFTRENCSLALWWENGFPAPDEESHILPISIDDLTFSDKELYETLGYRDAVPDEYILSFIDRLKKELFAVCVPQFGYRLLDGVALGTSMLIVGNQVITPYRIITKALEKSDCFYLLLATVGKEANEWILRKRGGADIMETWIADALGSVLVEAIVTAGKIKLEQIAQDKGWRITNSYSPGYCSWNVSEQRRLFAMLPKGFCGVTLTESSLMLPIKSVSALVGVGENVEKSAYHCDICTKKDCYKRRVSN